MEEKKVKVTVGGEGKTSASVVAELERVFLVGFKVGRGGGGRMSCVV